MSMKPILAFLVLQSEGGGTWTPGAQGAVYDPEENPMQRYNKDLLKVTMPDRVDKLVEDMEWTSKSKRLMKVLLYKLMAQEILLAKLDAEDKAMALMEFQIECIKANAMANTVDTSTAEWVLFMDVIRDHARIVFSRSDKGWERILHATFIRRIEESISSMGGTPHKPGITEQIAGAISGPPPQQK